MESKALVSRGPLSQGKWAIEGVRLRELQDDEVVVEIVASGICHTDLHCGDTPDDKGVPAVYYPRVLGHEVSEHTYPGYQEWFRGQEVKADGEVSVYTVGLWVCEGSWQSCYQCKLSTCPNSLVFEGHRQVSYGSFH